MPSPYPTRGIVQAEGLAALHGDPEVFPSLPGQDFVQSKAAGFATAIKQAGDGAEVRASAWAAPLYSFKVQFNALRDRPASAVLPLGSELQQLLGFFNARMGRYGFFFYHDPSDHRADGDPAGTGDGATTRFQLARMVGRGTPYASLEPVYALWNAPEVTVDGAPATGFTVEPWGLLSFAVPPAAGAVIRWSGDFLFVCRFDQDRLELQQLVRDLWSQGGLQFVSLFP